MAETEPRVLTADVRVVLLRALSSYDADEGESVAMLAERAGKSTRTIYRILGESTESISLGLADAVIVAAGGHLTDCRLLWPDGAIE